MREPWQANGCAPWSRRTWLCSLCQHARLRVYLIYLVVGQFIDAGIITALGSDVPRAPDHLLLLGMLHRRGVLPRVDFIETPSRLAECTDFDEFAQRVAWSTGPFYDMARASRRRCALGAREWH